MYCPNIGERVHARPRPGLQVQRGDGLYQQCLPEEGMECTWDDYLERRRQEGAVLPAPLSPPAAEEVS